MENGQPTMSVSGWLPNGMKVYFTLPIVSNELAFEHALVFTDALLAKGFNQREPGLNEGELKEQIGYVSRRNKKNDDGTTTPVLDLYVNNERMEYRFLAVYLNTPEDVQAFENASGLRLTALPLNPTDAPVDRDNAALVVKMPKPATIIYTNNKAYDENATTKKPKRFFVRWEGIGIQKEPQNGLNANVGANGGNSQTDWNVETVKEFITSYQGKLDTDQLLIALDVTRFGEWTHGKEAAYGAAEAALKIAKVAF